MNARKIVSNRFSGIQMTRRYLSIYDMLISESEVRIADGSFVVDETNQSKVDEL